MVRGDVGSDMNNGEICQTGLCTIYHFSIHITMCVLAIVTLKDQIVYYRLKDKDMKYYFKINYLYNDGDHGILKEEELLSIPPCFYVSVKIPSYIRQKGHI